MADIEIRMLGKFEILMDGKPVLAALKQSRKATMLIQYLVLQKGEKVTHKDLTDTLWNGERSTNPDMALRAIMHRFRNMIDAEGLKELAAMDGAGTVLNAVVGIAGLDASLAAIESGHDLALANKETLVAGGCYVMPLAARHKAPIVPIDSEHSAIFQCLAGEKSPVRRLIVTCSGGAFRDRSREELAHVTVEQALKHPQWRMGDKITIDSATLVNKGFEVIEAHWLFGVPAERISVLIHPQSIVHSMVEFGDGAIKAQLGSPDMRTPIAYALSFPQRLDRPVAPFSFAEHPTLTFAEVDRIKYPALDLAYDCLRRGGTAGCTMNGANEVAVAAFLARRCGYLEIVRSIEYALGKSSFAAVPSLGDLGETNAEARCLAAEYLRL